jgi:putative membrane protein
VRARFGGGGNGAAEEKTMRTLMLTAAGVMALAFAQPALSQTKTTATTVAMEVKTPEDFANMAAQSNMLEIETSNLALEKSKKDDIRAFAQRMVEDHTNAGKEMQKAAAADGVTAVPAKLDDEHGKMLNDLANASAEDFDSQYAQLQVQAHEQAVALFTSYSQQSGALADLAKKLLPALQEHLEMARDLKG